MDRQWWGKYDLEADREYRWRIGPLTFWLLRSPTQWRINVEPSGDPLDDRLEVEVPADEPAPQGAEVRRFGFKSSPPIEIRPIAADRPIIINSETPFLVPPGEEATIFVSTPVWVQFHLGRGNLPLLDIPCYRPSDTWFGPSTRSGELCYAARTGARLNLPHLPVRPHRAVSVVTIRNRAKTALPLERIRLPLPHLSLYGSADGQLWTDQLTLEREEDGEMARVSLSRGGPKQAVDATKIAEPRLKHDKGQLLRSFGGLIGLSGGSRNE